MSLVRTGDGGTTWVPVAAPPVPPATATDALAAQRVQGIARAKLIGGTTSKPSIGVVLDVLEPTELLAAFTPHGQPF